MSDAFAQLAQMMGGSRGSALGGWRFGEVLTAGRGRLQVVCGGLTLDREDLYLAPHLDYTWTQDHGEENLLRRGDRLLLLVSPDEQDYFVLQKAVFL